MAMDLNISLERATYVKAPAAPIYERQTEHLVEVTVINRAVPTDADQIRHIT